MAVVSSAENKGVSKFELCSGSVQQNVVLTC